MISFKDISFNEATIRHHANRKSFERGQAYAQAGSVVELIQRGHTLSAAVEGSEAEPYRVRIDFDQGGITQAFCTCPYDYEGWCKHIVATLLTCLHDPDLVEQRPELAKQLAALNREQLQMILQNLAAAQPEWLNGIEQQITQLIQPQTPTGNQPAANLQKMARRTAVDPTPFQQQVSRIIDNYQGQWNDEPALDEIRELIQKADNFIERGDGHNGLIILTAMIRAYVEDWMNLDGSSGESGIFFEELDDALTEAILTAELSPAERQQWQQDLQTWQAEVDSYGVDGFEMSLAALAQGWEYEPLQRVLAGEITELGAWDREAPDYADDLARIRLKILERQSRYQEYLYLAEAEGQTAHYLRMLAQLGQTEVVMAQAQHQMTTTEDALTLAQTLRQQGQLSEALSIATQGLEFDGYGKHRLAVWTSELAEAMGQPEAALQARLTAFKDYPALEDYLKVRELAGPQWPSLQKDLLQWLRQDSNSLDARSRAAIFLEENLIDDAMATVELLSSYQSEIIHSVMAAAISYRPDWVIENARSRAEAIMNEGKAKYYDHAINWLRQVRAAYLQSGQQQEWQHYRTALLQTHTRKRKLVDLLQERDLI